MISDSSPTDSDTAAPVDESAPAKTRSNRFFRASRIALPREDARRQGDISQLAFLTLGGRDPAIAFLNNENAELGGRPLALATASAEGFEQVAAAIRAWAPASDAPRDPGSE